MKKAIIAVVVIVVLGVAAYFSYTGDLGSLFQGAMRVSNVRPTARVQVPNAQVQTTQVVYDIPIEMLQTKLVKDNGNYFDYDLYIYTNNLADNKFDISKYNSYKFRYVMKGGLTDENVFESDLGLLSGDMKVETIGSDKKRIQGTIPVKISLTGMLNAAQPTMIYVTGQILGYDKDGKLIGKSKLISRKYYVQDIASSVNGQNKVDYKLQAVN